MINDSRIEKGARNALRKCIEPVAEVMTSIALESYRKGAEDMRARAAAVGQKWAAVCEDAIRALPIDPARIGQDVGEPRCTCGGCGGTDCPDCGCVCNYDGNHEGGSDGR